MISAELFVSHAWDWLSQIINQRPVPFLAGLLFALILLVMAAVIVFLVRYRLLNSRLRQLHHVVELQATILEKLKAHIDEKIDSVSWQQQRFATAVADSKSKRTGQSSTALIREELASARMDLLSDEAEPAHSPADSP
jgi:predicted PurR-regulated permease PerM